LPKSENGPVRLAPELKVHNYADRKYTFEIDVYTRNRQYEREDF